jgi:glycosyltransferase involved in cell wall biosynthesis
MKCLNSISILADEIIIVDTGSTDNTCELIQGWIKKINAGNNVKIFPVGNKFHDADGDFDFGAAKTHSLTQATKDWVMWLDANDVVENQIESKKAFIALVEKHPRCFIRFPTKMGRVIFDRIRICPREGARMVGRIHEYLDCNGEELPTYRIGIPILNEGKPRDLERNLRSLKKQWEAQKDPRTAFYLGSTYSGLDMPTEAIRWFRKRTMTKGWDVMDEEYYKSLEMICEILVKFWGDSHEEIYQELFDITEIMIRDQRDRMEGYFYRSKYHQYKKEYDRALLALRMYVRCKIPKDRKLWLSNPVYGEKAILKEIEYCKVAMNNKDVREPEQILDYTDEMRMQSFGINIPKTFGTQTIF